MISHPSAQNTNIHTLPPLACYSRLQSEQVKFQKKTGSCPAGEYKLTSLYELDIASKKK